MKAKRVHISKPIPSLEVHGFLDYRAFLRAFYEEKKRQRGGFSYRLFSQYTGIESPNYMKLILDGHRKMALDHALRVARYCGLSKAESRYFIALVRWNDSKSTEERDALWSEILELRSESASGKISSQQLQLLTKWQWVALLEMIRLEDFAPTEEWISKRFRGTLSFSEMNEALRCMEEAGLVEKRDQKYIRLENSLKTTDDVPSQAIRMYHRSVASEAAKTLDAVDVSKREFISTTVCVRKEDLADLKDQMRALRDRFLKRSAETRSPEEVYQLNLQFFPLTKDGDKK